MRELDVLIATHGNDGLKKIEEMRLPSVKGVTYIITWQKPAGDYSTSPLLKRDDIEIHTSDTIGLSRNRNLGISVAKAPVCLIADNDLYYTPSQLETVISTFKLHQELQIATFKHIGADKMYPENECDFTESVPKGYSVSSIEIAFRRNAIKDIRFDERFGIGAEYCLGEEEKFIHDCRKSGISCRFFPIEITRHDDLSTGKRPLVDARVARGHGAFIRCIYGFVAGFPRVPLFVYRNWRSGRVNFLFGLKNVMLGFLKYRD